MECCVINLHSLSFETGWLSPEVSHQGTFGYAFQVDNRSKKEAKACEEQMLPRGLGRRWLWFHFSMVTEKQTALTLRKE